MLDAANRSKGSRKWNAFHCSVRKAIWLIIKGI